MTNDMREFTVTKSHPLVQATYAMTVWEQRILLSCVCQIDPRLPIPNDKTYTLTIDQARDLFEGSDPKSLYRDMSRAVEKLYARDVKIKLNDTDTLQTRFIQSIVWSPDNYQVTLKFASDIKPYLSQIRNNFSGYKLKNIVQLTSSYAIRIYEMIVSWAVQNQLYKEFEINDFREFLGIGDKYKEISSLKRFVISPAVEQINANTDFNIDISFRKCKREIRWIQLRFNQKQEAKALADEAKTKRKARTLQNQTAKHNRLLEQQKKAIQHNQEQIAIEWETIPTGTIYCETSGRQWQKEASGFLYCSETNSSIPPGQIGAVLASGKFTRVDVMQQSLEATTEHGASVHLSPETKAALRTMLLNKMLEDPEMTLDKIAQIYHSKTGESL